MSCESCGLSVGHAYGCPEMVWFPTPATIREEAYGHGRNEERAAIVAWLRRLATTWPGSSDAAEAWRAAASGIERGEHTGRKLTAEEIATARNELAAEGWRCGKCDGGDFPEHALRCPLRRQETS